MQAHKVILSAGSPVFRSRMEGMPSRFQKAGNMTLTNIKRKAKKHWKMELLEMSMMMDMNIEKTTRGTKRQMSIKNFITSKKKPKMMTEAEVKYEMMARINMIMEDILDEAVEKSELMMTMRRKAKIFMINQDKMQQRLEEKEYHKLHNIKEEAEDDD